MTDRHYQEIIANVFWKAETFSYNFCMMRAEEAIDKLRDAGWKSGEEVDSISSESWSDGFEAGQDSMEGEPPK